MNIFALKLIAIITMLIDHVGVIFISPDQYPMLYIFSRGIGRIAFPLFAFMLVEGFEHTKDINRYLKRLGIFALISEIPFDIAFYQYHYGTNFFVNLREIYQNGSDYRVLISQVFYHQNIFFTLFLGLLLIYLIRCLEKQLQKHNMLRNLCEALLLIGFCLIAYFMKSDYDLAGILLITAFYIFRESKLLQSLSLFVIYATLLCDFKSYLITNNIVTIISIFAAFAMLPIVLYNGKKGKDIKYFFYIFYPAHLFILFLINQLIY